MLDLALLLEQHRALGIEPPQETWVGLHLGFQDHRWLLGRLPCGFPICSRRNLEQTIEPPLQDPVGAALEHPVEELVAGSHGGRRAAVQICTGCTKPCTDNDCSSTSTAPG